MEDLNISEDAVAKEALKSELGINDPVEGYNKIQLDALFLANERTSSFFRILQFMGSTVKALPIDASINGITSATSALTNRAIQRVGFFIDKTVKRVVVVPSCYF